MNKRISLTILLFITLFAICNCASVNTASDKQISTEKATNNNNNNDDDLIPMFAMPLECKDVEREEPVFGKLPSCEPTCEQPNAFCPKIYIVMDSAVCFCKSGYLRNTKINKCVKFDECPKHQKLTTITTTSN